MVALAPAAGIDVLVRLRVADAAVVSLESGAHVPGVRCRAELAAAAGWLGHSSAATKDAADHDTRSGRDGANVSDTETRDLEAQERAALRIGDRAAAAKARARIEDIAEREHR